MKVISGQRRRRKGGGGGGRQENDKMTHIQNGKVELINFYHTGVYKLWCKLDETILVGHNFKLYSCHKQF